MKTLLTHPVCKSIFGQKFYLVKKSSDFNHLFSKVFFKSQLTKKVAANSSYFLSFPISLLFGGRGTFNYIPLGTHWGSSFKLLTVSRVRFKKYRLFFIHFFFEKNIAFFAKNVLSNYTEYITMSLI